MYVLAPCQGGWMHHGRMTNEQKALGWPKLRARAARYRASSVVYITVRAGGHAGIRLTTSKLGRSLAGTGTQSAPAPATVRELSNSISLSIHAETQLPPLVASHTRLYIHPSPRAIAPPLPPITPGVVPVPNPSCSFFRFMRVR